MISLNLQLLAAQVVETENSYLLGDNTANIP